MLRSAPARALLACLIAVALAAATPPREASARDPGGGATEARVEIGWEVFQLELANDPETRTRGLMGRRSIPEAGGMLFQFPSTRPRSFWMKNCLVDMDLLFLDDDARVVKIHSMSVEPPRSGSESAGAYEARLEEYWSDAPARYAIELRAGTAARLGLRPGVQLTLPPLPPPR